MRASERVIRNTGILYARMAFTMFLSLYTIRVLLASLGAEDFGVYSLVAGMIAMLGFLNASMSASSQRFMSYAHGEADVNKQRKIFNISLVMHIVVALIMVAALEILGVLLFENVLNIPSDRASAAFVMYHFVVLSVFFTILTVPYEAVITARENMVLVALLGVLEAILKLAIALVLTVTSSDKLILYGALMAALPLLLLLVRIVYCHKCYNECVLLPVSRFDKVLAKDMVSFGAWSFLTSSTSMIANYGQGIVLNIFFGVRANAAQGVANQVNGQLGALSVTMLRALNPVIAKSEGAGNRRSMLKATSMGSKLSFFLVMLLGVPAVIEMEFLLGIWLKEVPEYAVIFCRLLLIKQLLEQFYITIAKSIEAVGEIKFYCVSRAIINLLPLAISYLVFHAGYDAYYLYIVFLGYAGVNLICSLLFARYKCGLNLREYFSGVFVRCLLMLAMSASFGFVLLVYMESGYLRLVGVCFLSVLGACLSVWLVGLVREERQLLSELLVKARSTLKRSPS